MFIEKIGTELSGDYKCAKRDTGVCDGCGNCRNTPRSIQERNFFLFDLVSGRNSLRCLFDDKRSSAEKQVCLTCLYDGGTDETIDFLFGYTGYEYKSLTDNSGFMESIAASIDIGRPVIAKVSPDDGIFRVITGYDNDTLLEPDYSDAQEAPSDKLTIENIEAIYVIGDKVAPKYSFADGLRRAIRVMEMNAEERVWQGYIDNMGLYGRCGFGNAPADEKKRRMAKVAETMWHTFNCHNYAEIFRQRLVPELQKPELERPCRDIGYTYGYTHDLAWALIELDKKEDWSDGMSRYLGEMIELTLCQLQNNDDKVLRLTKGIYEIITKQ